MTCESNLEEMYVTFARYARSKRKERYDRRMIYAIMYKTDVQAWMKGGRLT